MVIERVPPLLDRLPRPVFGRSENLPAGSLARRHVHPWVQLSWASSGVLVVRTPQGSHLAPPQRAVWVPAGLPHEVASSSRARMRSLYIDAAVATFAPPRCRVLTVTPLARELIAAVSGLPPEYDAQGAEGRLVAVLLDQLASLSEVAFSLPWPTDARLVPICQAITDNPDDRRTMTDWGGRAGLTERTLGRLFLAQTGLTFGKWRRQARLLAALTALEEGQNVTAAALGCGFEAPSAFIAAFKEAFGTTPGAFLRGR